MCRLASCHSRGHYSHSSHVNPGTHTFLSVFRAIQESLSISLAGREPEDGADPSQPPSVSPVENSRNSLLSYSTVTDSQLSGHFGVASSFDEQLRIAMELSCREQEELDR